MHIIRSSNTIATLPTIIIRSSDCANFADRCLIVPDVEISGIPLHLVVNQLKHSLYEILIYLMRRLRVSFRHQIPYGLTDRENNHSHANIFNLRSNCELRTFFAFSGILECCRIFHGQVPIITA